MGGLPLSERERAYTIACERIAPRIQGRQQQTTANPESGPNDPEGTAEDTPQETNTVGRGERGGNRQNQENQDDNDGRKVLFDDKLHIRWIEAAGRKPIFANNAPPVVATSPMGILKPRPDDPFTSAPKILANFEHGSPALVEIFLTADPRLHNCDDWKQHICTPKVNGAVILVNGLPNPIEIPASEGRFLSTRRVMKLVHSELMRDVGKNWWMSVEKERRGEVAKAWENRVYRSLEGGESVPSPPVKIIDYLLENIVFDGFTFVMRDASGRTWLKMHTKVGRHA
ncbi:uncharacterized protein ARMOST_02431 [Armillaria ostoyae]|uniref:DUF6699 domain-containing protein n=1 Tax=Armillaria ostoyae TaxID=47428 RepID=A0A284QRN2_ARMOS|nr:uncharacterized protein ARMOST_02431 [Armillaria ostoyae]